MIRIYPEIETRIKCNSCGQELIADSFFLTGTHILCSGICPACHSDTLFMEMPTSAGLIYPTVIRQSDGKRVDDMPFTNWFIDSLPRAYAKRVNEKIQIEKIIRSGKEKNKILILSTIDS